MPFVDGLNDFHALFSDATYYHLCCILAEPSRAKWASRYSIWFDLVVTFAEATVTRRRSSRGLTVVARAELFGLLFPASHVATRCCKITHRPKHDSLRWHMGQTGVSKTTSTPSALSRRATSGAEWRI